MSDPAKMDEFLRTSIGPKDSPGLSEHFHDRLQTRLATQRLGQAERRQLDVYLLLCTLASVAAMWWLAIPWTVIVPGVLVPAIFFLLFRRIVWPKSGN